MNSSHQQSPKENIESKRKKTQETYLSSKRSKLLQKFPAKSKFEEDE